MLVLGLGSILVICIGLLVWYYGSLWSAQRKFENLAKNKPPLVMQEDFTQEVQGQKEHPMQALEDYVGWLSVEGTQIDYPVMQNKQDPEYYLYRDFEGKYAYSGTPFLDAACEIALPERNLVIYAHNMKDGSMFGGLKHYRDVDYLKAHPTFTFETPEGSKTYKIFALIEFQGNYDTLGLLEGIQLDTDEAYNGFMDKIRQHTLYDKALVPTERKSLCFLMTCVERNRGEGRLVLIGYEQ